MVAHTYRIIMGAGYAGTKLFPFAMLPAILMVVSLLILRKYHLDEETKAMLGVEEQ